MRGARSARKAHPIMVASKWMPTGYSALPSYVFPAFPSQALERVGTYADAVQPGLGLGDNSWTVVQPYVQDRSNPAYYGTLKEKRGRPLTSYPTIPYRDDSARVQPHGLGLSRKSMTRPKKNKKKKCVTKASRNYKQTTRLYRVLSNVT